MAMGLRTKIILSFVSIVALLSILGAVSYYNRNILFDQVIALEEEVGRLKAYNDLSIDIGRAVMPPNDYLITGDLKEKDEYLKLADGVRNGFSELLGSIEKNEQAVLIKKAENQFSILNGKALELFDLKNPLGDKKGAVVMHEMDAISDDIVFNYLNKFYIIEREGVRESIALAERTRTKADIVLFSGMVMSLILTVFIISYFIRSILSPILELKKGASIIGAGNLDHRIKMTDGFEINLLVGEFNNMAEKLKSSYNTLEKKVEERTKELNDVNKELKELSITDGLTGLYNHRYFYERLTDEVKRSARYGRTFSVIMGDLDYFKNYNDTNGHIEGDALLKDLAAFLKKSVREHDTLARYGGEEFAIVLPETEKSKAADLAERIRVGVSKYPFPNREKQPGESVTISFGLAAFPMDAYDPKGLLEKADYALYMAKKKGRNRVEKA